MSWRIKASKYRNAVPVTPKLDDLIRDLSIGSYKSHGNFIQASAAFMAFNWDRMGNNIAVLPLDSKGRRAKTDMPLIYAHTDFVTDFAFSPFDDGLLVTGSQDTMVKVWRIPECGLAANGLKRAELVLPPQPRRIETVTFHTTADHLVSTGQSNTLLLWDISQGKELHSFSDHEDEIQSVSWQPVGKMVATQCKDKRLRIIDPRGQSLFNHCSSHQGVFDSKVAWLGDSTRILTTGFGANRSREIFIRDVRKLTTPVKHLSLDMSSGILIPLLDVDTNMCFLAGKGDRNIQFIEISDAAPHIIEGLKYSGDQSKGACLVPKRAMNVMQAEVNRVLQLCDSSVVPITWQVPRKNHREFYADIYPETQGMAAAASGQDWWDGNDALLTKMSLDPKKRVQDKLVVFQMPPNGYLVNEEQEPSQDQEYDRDVASRSPRGHDGDNFYDENPDEEAQTSPLAKCENYKCDIDASLDQLRRQNSLRDKKKMFEDRLRRNCGIKPFSHITEDHRTDDDEAEKEVSAVDGGRTNEAFKRSGSQKFARVSKFKHMRGEVIVKGKFDNLRDISKTIPAECNFVHVNHKRIAVPLNGTGGKIALLELSKPGRMANTMVPMVVNGSAVMDFAFDPFDAERLVVGCDDGQFRVWKLPKAGMLAPNSRPQHIISGHTEKMTLIKFHPLARNILLTAAFDRSVKIWDMDDLTEARIALLGHEDQLFSAEWSTCGQYVATVCKDGKIRLFEPKGHSEEADAVAQGGDLLSRKGARLAWVLNNKFLVLTAFGRQSERLVSLYQADNLVQLNIITLDVSPSLLRPFFDEDSSTLFLSGKGDSTVVTFEVTAEAPYFHPLYPYRGNGYHQGLAFLPKNACDVKAVEFLRVYRVTENAIEPISFTVPRLRSTLFQDDLFPLTKVYWEPCLTAQEWLRGVRRLPRLVSLQPDKMDSVSGVDQRALAARSQPDDWQLSLNADHDDDDDKEDDDDSKEDENGSPREESDKEMSNQSTEDEQNLSTTEASKLHFEQDIDLEMDTLDQDEQLGKEE